MGNELEQSQDVHSGSLTQLFHSSASGESNNQGEQRTEPVLENQRSALKQCLIYSKKIEALGQHLGGPVDKVPLVFSSACHLCSFTSASDIFSIIKE